MSKQAQQENDHNMTAAGFALSDLGCAMIGRRHYMVEVGSIKIKAPMEPGLEFLAVLVGVDGDGKEWVAFHSATTLEETIRGLDSRLANGTLKFREQRPFQG